MSGVTVAMEHSKENTPNLVANTASNLEELAASLLKNATASSRDTVMFLALVENVGLRQADMIADRMGWQIDPHIHHAAASNNSRTLQT